MSTLQPADQISGGAGNDTLQVSMSENWNGGAFISGIEALRITSTDAKDFNATGITGLTQVSNFASSGALTVTNISSLAGLSVQSVANTNAIFKFADTLLSGTADKVSVTLNAYDGGAAANQALKIGSQGDALGNGIETLAITTTGAASRIGTVSGSSTANGANSAVTTITISGDQNLTVGTSLTAANNSLKTVNATDLTGKLSVDFTGTARDLNVTGGKSDDRFNFGSTLTASDTLNGGDGTDTLVMTGGLTGTLSNITNIERLEANDSSTYSFTALSGLKSVVFTGNNTNTVVTNLPATGANVTVTTSATNAAVNLATLTLNASTPDSTVALTLDSTSTALTGGADVATLNATNVATLNVTSTGGNLLTGTNDSAANKANELGNVAIKTLTLAGDTRASITTTGTTTKSIDATSFTGASTLNAGSVTTGISITGGFGADTITGGSGNDLITGGDGADVIDSAAGIDSVAGGAGNDAVVISTTANLTSADTINGGDGTDTLRFSENGAVDLRSSNANLPLLNVTNMEIVELAGAGQQTLSLDDGTVGALGGTATIVVGKNVNHIIDASGITVSTSRVVATVAAANVSGGVVYRVGNGIENVTLSSANDTFTVANAPYVSGTDTIDGGGGLRDFLNFTSNPNAAIAISAAQLAGVKNVEVFQVAAADAAAKYTVTLNDAIVAANYDSINQRFTVQRQASDTAGLVVDAATVAATGSNLLLRGAAGADTLTGGAGADTLVGGAGADSLTGNAGNDVFLYNAAGQMGTGEVVAGGDGTDTIRFQSADGLAFTSNLTAVTISSVEQIDIQRGATANFAGSVISGQTWTIIDGASGIDGTLQVTASAGGVTNLSGLSFGTTPTFTAGATITGSSVADTVIGTKQGDIFRSSAGADTLDGGTGRDIFELNTTDSASNAASNADTVNDFAGGASGDIVRMSITVDNVANANTNGGAIATASGTATTIGSWNYSGTTLRMNGAATDPATASANVGQINVSSGLTLNENNFAINLTLTGTAAIDANKSIGGSPNADIFDISGLTAANAADKILTIAGLAGDDTYTVSVANGVANGNHAISDTAGVDALILTGQLANNKALDLADSGNTTLTRFAITNDQIENVNASDVNYDGRTLTITGSASANAIVGGAGVDTINGAAGADTITGGSGADTIAGGAGADLIILTEAAGAIDVVVYAGAGNAAGFDATATGEAGDTIIGFTAGAGNDQLNLKSFQTNALGNAITEVATASTTQLNSEVVIFTGNAVSGIGAAVTALNGQVLLTAGSANDTFTLVYLHTDGTARFGVVNTGALTGSASVIESSDQSLEIGSLGLLGEGMTLVGVFANNNFLYD